MTENSVVYHKLTFALALTVNSKVKSRQLQILLRNVKLFDSENYYIARAHGLCLHTNVNISHDQSVLGTATM